jgi:autotransporter-associated beta strand protein
VPDGAAEQDLIISAHITGAGVGLTKTNLGTLVLTNQNTYNQEAVVDAGTLIIHGLQTDIP